jgi:hypothetical protein
MATVNPLAAYALSISKKRPPDARPFFRALYGIMGMAAIAPLLGWFYWWFRGRPDAIGGIVVGLLFFPIGFHCITVAVTGRWPRYWIRDSEVTHPEAAFPVLSNPSASGPLADHCPEYGHQPVPPAELPTITRDGWLMRAAPLDSAKQVATRGLSFGIVANCDFFPPRDVLNAFLECGYDDLDDEDGVLRWLPFSVVDADYDRLLAWWRLTHPSVRCDSLGVPNADFSAWFTEAVTRKLKPADGNPAVG